MSSARTPLKATKSFAENLTFWLVRLTLLTSEPMLRVRIAENMVYQANNAGFAKLKMQEDTYKKENERQQRAYKSLMIRCDALELSISGKNQEIDELKWDLKHEQQMSAIVRSEHARRH